MNGNRPAPGRGRVDPEVGVLSRDPERLWPDAIAFHGVRICLVLGLAILLSALFPPAPETPVVRYEAGATAPERVVAEIGFEVPKDRDDLERERAAAAASVDPTFDLRPEATDTTEQRIARFFDGVAQAADVGGRDAVADTLAAERIGLSEAQLTLLLEADARDRLREAALTAVRQYLPSGVIDGAQASQLTSDQIIVRSPDGVDRRRDRAEILSPQEFYDAAIDELMGDGDPTLTELLRLVLIRYVEPSLEPNILVTGEQRELARDAVPDVRSSVATGATLIEPNARITPADVERLDAYYAALAARGMLETARTSPLPFVGAVLVNVLLLLAYGVLVFFFRTEIYRNLRWILVQAVLIAAYIGAAYVIDRQGFMPELLPVPFVVLTAAVLWDGRMALVMALVLAVLTGVQPAFASAGTGLVGTIAVGGAAAALTTRAFRRRAQMWYFIAVASAAYAAVLIGLGLAAQSPFSDIVTRIGAGTGNVFVSGILALGLISLFEWFTGITTDQTLLEWADPNRPLLRRLSMEAPGTYSHTINVANFAEAAANAIGANGLLCRVGIYYHDVGKMLKPQYFVENQGGMNPHDRMKPETSADIVREHVTEGLRLAREAKVPPVIQAFIPEHHGTQLISFFYQKAKEENPDQEPDRERFSYPGPRPRSRETAIAMLADSIESAARALKDPTEERIRSLVDGIVSGKVSDGQLDESGLTLTELGLLREQFVKMLGSMYHHRIDYPATRHLTEAPGEGDGGAAAGEGGAGGGAGDGSPGEGASPGRAAEESEGAGDRRGQGEGSHRGAPPGEGR